MGKEADVPNFKLNDSTSIPAIGLGTVSITESPETVKAAILKALEIGYRHFDTASAYRTEEAIGKALQEAFATGLVKREDVYLTTKIAPHELHIDEILSNLKKSLSNLQVDYVNLYLIHWPLRQKHESKFGSTNVDDYLPLDLKGTWEAMEKLVELGLTKSIGVSNFYVKKLQELLPHAKIVPAVNQIELHPAFQQDKLRAFCQKKGIHVSAWSPIGAPGVVYGSVGATNNPVFKEIAEKHGKSVAQIALRWIHELGCSALPKSYNEGRMTENLSIFDFSLTDEDHERIKTIKQVSLCQGPFFPQFNGTPWRSFDEFYDNEE